jgi:hypothetical protein
MPEGFKRIAVIKKRSLLGDNSIIKPEGIWVPEGQKEGPLYLFDNVESTI